MRILIVEDNEISAGILESNLRPRNYDTVVARTGPEALQMLEAHWDINLVIADIMMPEMNGLELVRRMREDSKWQEIPVIVCTSLADAEHVAMAARLGCRHYLLKPVERVQLLMLVDKILTGEKQVSVLGDRNKIAAKYGLTPQSLNRALAAFAQLVTETIAALTPDASNASAPAGSVNFARLAEGAIILGAERLLLLVRAMQVRGAEAVPTPEERDALLKELKLIDRALTAQLQKDKTPAATGKDPAAIDPVTSQTAPTRETPKEETVAAS